MRALEERLRRHLGTKVSIRDRGGKGTIVVEYYGPGDMSRLLRKMGCPGELAD